MERIYLDNNASTRVSKEVLEEMLPLLKDEYGNPSSSHQLGTDAKDILETARSRVAALLGCSPENIIFTSGGTESNNLAIGGVVKKLNTKRHFITSAIEHPSVLNIFHDLEEKGHRVTYLPVYKSGVISLKHLKEAILPDTVLISLMLVNNVLGTVFPIKEVGEIARRNNILFHCDAIQGLGKMPIDVEEFKVDFLSVSSHKIHGPKGAGAVYVRDLTTISPCILGGGQEKGLRGGTEALPAIIGMGKACEIALNTINDYVHSIEILRDRLEQGILEILGDSFINCKTSARVCNTSSTCFTGMNGTKLLEKLSDEGIMISHGSACSSKNIENSHVLKSIGLTKEQICSSLRFSLSKETTEAQIQKVLQTIQHIASDSQSKVNSKLTCTECRSISESTATGYLKTIYKDLHNLWESTKGDPRICIAVLDGPVDKSHPSFKGSDFEQVDALIELNSQGGLASMHGTHVASIIFGNHEGPIKGVAPNCRGLIIPVFNDNGDGNVNCTQLDLARAINQAVYLGANIVSISGGQLTSSTKADEYLEHAVELCAKNGIIIVAAAGNDGCECLHLPAAIDSVLAVGAMNSDGTPLGSSNWGKEYQNHGILAPGKDILGAVPGGGTMKKTGTSFAAPFVAGVAALLLSLQMDKTGSINASQVKNAILSSALSCEDHGSNMCKRFLTGKLNISSAQNLLQDMIKKHQCALESEINQFVPSIDGIKASELIQADSCNMEKNQDLSISKTNINKRGRFTMTNYVENDVQVNAAYEENNSYVAASETNMEHKNDYVSASGCDCEKSNTITSNKLSLVYAIGQIGFDMISESRRDYFLQLGVNPNDPEQMLKHLQSNPANCASINWVLNQEQTPIYAIIPTGSFGFETYKLLVEYFESQIKKGVERVSIPGYIAGKVKLMSGQVVPAIVPDQRGMYSWSTNALVNLLIGNTDKEKDKARSANMQADITNFLERVYYEIRNLGITSQERAINYAATNAFQIEYIYKSSIEKGMNLDSIDFERSPICRPGSDCWDIKLTFFNPARRMDQARIVYRFTVDVSDVVPVLVGKVRNWHVY